MIKKIAFLIVVSLIFYACKSKTTEQNPDQPKNIILLIGDGMGVSQVYAGMTANIEALNLEQCQNIGFSKTNSATDYITDSGAGGTAISSGLKTYNGAVGVGLDSLPLQSILEYAEINGKATGLVATSAITHATPASFIAHVKSRYLYEDIAKDFLSTDIDLFIGGGCNHFRKRSDSIDLSIKLRAHDYQMVYQLDSLENIKSGKLAALLYPEAAPRMSEGRGEMLPLSTLKAIELLNQNEDGFFLMVEGSQIDWGGHENNTSYVIDEILDFDRAVGKAIEFAEKDGSTLVIITADHETGGMSLTGGDLNTGEVEAKYSTDNHTAVMVPVLAYGPGSDAFKGIYENTELYHKMVKAFGFNIN